MNFLHLHCQMPETRGEMVRRLCVIERISDGKTASQEPLWIEMPELAVMPQAEDAEPFLIMALLPAMAEGLDIMVEGAVSRQLLHSLAEFRELWHCWDARKFKQVEIHCSQYLEIPPKIDNPKAVSAFSGGLDSTFTAWRHKTRTDSSVLDLQYAMMVHGFDIPLRKESIFQLAFARGMQTLQTLDLPLFAIRTNCRTVFTLNWLIWHGAAVTACLQLFKGLCGVGLLGGTFGCNDLVFPYGSNPISDPLLSTSGFKIIHDSIAYNRVKKFAMLSEWPAGYNALRICYSGIDRGVIQEGNCGKCSKCVRSVLRLHFAGLPLPASFPGRPSILDILRVRPSAFEAKAWRGIYHEALARKAPLSLILAVCWMVLICFLAKVVKKGLQSARIWEPSFP